jgi:hypothetical protein
MVNIFPHLEKNICVFYTMPNQRYKRQTQKKVKGGWLWCETTPFKYLMPCKPGEAEAERRREAQQIEKAAREKEISMRAKELEAEKKKIDAQMDAKITAIKSTPTDVPPRGFLGNFGGSRLRKNKSQKRKNSKKSAKK